VELAEHKPLHQIELDSAEHILDFLAMHLPGRRWKETKLASAVPVLKLLAMQYFLPCIRQEAAGKNDLASAVRILKPVMHLPGNRWESFPSAVHVLNLSAVYLPESRWTETKLASAEHVLDLIAIHLLGSLWKEMKLAIAEPLLELLAMSQPGSR
jgi:hypothetical protein